MSIFYFAMHQTIRWIDMIGQIYQNDSGRVCVVGIWIFIVKFFQLFCMLKVFHNKNIFFK